MSRSLIPNLYIPLYVLLYEDYRNDERRQEAEELAHDLAAVFKQFNPGDKEATGCGRIIKRLDLDYQKTFGYVPRLVKSDISTERNCLFHGEKSGLSGRYGAGRKHKKI